jgi:GNAT superfamily N-acetyltransferase
VAVVISLDKITELSDADHAEIREMFKAVYPPEENADWPGRHIEWVGSDWCARVRGESGELVSHVGIILREASYDGQPVLVGGVGGVATHPAARRKGYATLGIKKAVEFFSEEVHVDCALLVCRPGLMEYYSQLGWREFDGQLLVRQHGELVEFTFNRVMTLGIGSEAPKTGVIDLQGPPW